MYLQISPILGCWGVRIGLAGVVVGSAIAFGNTTLAQVVPDNTLGGENSVVTSTDSVDVISGGATRGGNLFHSFDQFSIPNGRAALFDNGANIQNILTRVTGGSISNIDGLIQANGAASLFLLNPNGIIFGQNARLNIGGSFIATTASGINFADGTQFSATPGTGAPLLTVSVPLGLQFGTGAGEIINRSLAGDSNSVPVGLQVQAEKTLGLIGGNVNLEGSWLTARGGRIELGAVAAPGVVEINPDSSGFRFSFPTDLTLGDISLTTDTTVSPTRPAFVNVRSGGGGSIAINARNLSLFGGSELLAGISRNQGSASAVAGDIVINAQGSVTIDGLGQFSERFFSSGIYNSVEEGGTGKGGDVKITASSLLLRDRAVIAANTEGQGDAGNIQITATNLNDSILLEGGSFIQADSFSQSNAGNVTITADGRVSFDGFGNTGISSGVFSRLLTERGIGKSGSITIKARSLSVTEGAQINTGTFGQGDAGNINITAGESVSLDNNGRISSQVELTGTGKGSNINIRTGSLSLTDRAVLSVSNFGQGDAGNIFVQADSSISLSNSNIFSNVSGGAEGNGGTVNIKADSFSLADGSQIISGIGDGTSSVPGGRGNGGNVNIDVRDSFSASGRNNGGFSSAVFTSVGSGAEGYGGNVNITTGSLSLTDGAFISTSIFGQGDAGNVTINARDSIAFDGASSNNEFSAGVFSSVWEGGIGKGGNIDLLAGSLSLTNGAQLSANTFGRGDAGSVFVLVDDFVSLSNSYIYSNVGLGGTGNGGTVSIKANSLSLTDGAQIVTSALGKGNTGSINIEASDTISFTGADNDGYGFVSGVFSTVQSEGTGNGGEINIRARSLSLTDGALVNSSSLGQGNAGNVNINVRTLDLDRGGIFAESALGDGGNIQLQASKSLTLRGGSFISTRSRSGGNLTINSPLIIASYNGNNDIVTNALFGRGGQLGITAESIIGLTSRNFQELQSLAGTSDPTALVDFLSSLPSNDVASISSNPVVINTAEIFLNPYLAELPTTPVDASTLVSSGCPSGAENRFVVAGRGGLPPAPGDKLSADALLTHWATLTTPETSNRPAAEKSIPEAANTTTTPLVEATTWQFGSKGEIVLTNADPAAPNQFEATPSNCPSS